MKLNEFFETIKNYKNNYENEEKIYQDFPNDFTFEEWIGIIGRWYKINILKSENKNDT